MFLLLIVENELCFQSRLSFFTQVKMLWFTYLEIQSSKNWFVITSSLWCWTHQLGHFEMNLWVTLLCALFFSYLKISFCLIFVFFFFERTFMIFDWAFLVSSSSYGSYCYVQRSQAVSPKTISQTKQDFKINISQSTRFLSRFQKKIIVFSVSCSQLRDIFIIDS